MFNTRTLTLEISETLAAQLDLIMQITRRDINQVATELFTDYTNSFVNSIADNKEVNPMVTLKGSSKNVITPKMLETAYEISKKVYSGELTRTDGKQKIHDLCDMNEGSAQDYITGFLAMMSGDVYRRTLNTDGTEYILRNIYKDYGIEKFKLAIQATKKHLDYYSTVSPTTSPKRRKLIERLESELMGH